MCAAVKEFGRDMRAGDSSGYAVDVPEMFGCIFKW